MSRDEARRNRSGRQRPDRGADGLRHPDRNPVGFHVVNETRTDLVFFAPGAADSSFGVRADNSTSISIDGCRDLGYIARTLAGEEVAELRTTVCPGQDWVIRGKGDAEIVDREPFVEVD